MSEQAKTIELAVKSADFAYVQEHHAEVMKEYEKLLEQLDRDLKSGYVKKPYDPQELLERIEKFFNEDL